MKEDKLRELITKFGNPDFTSGIDESIRELNEALDFKDRHEEFRQAFKKYVVDSDISSTEFISRYMGVPSYNSQEAEFIYNKFLDEYGDSKNE